MPKQPKLDKLEAVQKAAQLRQMGVGEIRGPANCSACDRMGFNECKCERKLPKNGSKEGKRGTDTAEKNVGQRMQPVSTRDIDNLTKLLFFPDNRSVPATRVKNDAVQEQSYIAIVPLLEIKKLFNGYLRRWAAVDKVSVQDLERQGYSAVIRDGILTMTIPHAQRRENFLKSALELGMIKALTQHEDNRPVRIGSRLLNPFSMEIPDFTRD